MVLKAPGEEVDRISNCAENVSAWMGHGGLVGGSKNLELLPEFRQFKEHLFWFIGNRISEESYDLNDIISDSLEHLSWVNSCVSRNRGYSVAGETRRKRKSGWWVYIVKV